MTTATLQDTTLENILALGYHLESLRRRHGGESNHFEEIVNLLDALHPSDKPDVVLVNLRNMGLEDQFLDYMAETGRELPETVAYGGPVRWVIAPVL